MKTQSFAAMLRPQLRTSAQPPVQPTAIGTTVVDLTTCPIVEFAAAMLPCTRLFGPLAP